MISSRPSRRSQSAAASNNAFATSLIVDRLEHPEATAIRLVERVVARIVARHDPADDFAARARQKKRGIAMLIKRVFLAIEELLSLDQERRHPGRIIRINTPREI